MSIPRKTPLVAGYLACAIFIVAAFPCAAGSSSEDSKIAEIRQMWDARVTEVFKVGRSDDEVSREMAGLYVFSGRYTLGGSGAYQRVFVIDDYFQIVAVFDVSGRLLATPVLASRTKWVRLPSGELIEGPKKN